MSKHMEISVSACYIMCPRFYRHFCLQISFHRVDSHPCGAQFQVFLLFHNLHQISFLCHNFCRKLFGNESQFHKESITLKSVGDLLSDNFTRTSLHCNRPISLMTYKFVSGRS